MLAVTEPSHASSEIFEHLVSGDEEACQKVLDRIREDQEASVMRLCEIITHAFHTIGQAWECSYTFCLPSSP